MYGITCSLPLCSLALMPIIGTSTTPTSLKSSSPARLSTLMMVYWPSTWSASRMIRRLRSDAATTDSSPLERVSTCQTPMSISRLSQRRTRKISDLESRTMSTWSLPVSFEGVRIFVQSARSWDQTANTSRLLPRSVFQFSSSSFVYPLIANRFAYRSKTDKGKLLFQVFFCRT